MKKYILLFFTMLFPYVPMILLVSGASVELLLAVTFAVFLIAFITGIAYLVCAVRNKWNAEHLALANMIVKLVQIPAYVLVFVIGACGVVFIQFIAVTLFMFLFDCITILLSGIVAIPAAIRARTEDKIGTVHMIVFGISAFVFCIDVVSSVILYIKIKRANRRLLKEESDPELKNDEN